MCSSGFAWMTRSPVGVSSVMLSDFGRVVLSLARGSRRQLHSRSLFPQAHRNRHPKEARRSQRVLIEDFPCPPCLLGECVASSLAADVERSVFAIGCVAGLAAAEVAAGDRLAISLVRQQLDKPGLVLNLLVQ